VIGNTLKHIPVVNGSDFITKDLDHLANENNVNLNFSRPEQPMDKSYVVLFNGSFRDDCLNVN
jgi:putative transposase